MQLLDINVWLGLAFKRHKHHELAIAWFHSIGPLPCCFCRLTQIGFLRLATNPQAMGNDVVTLQQAWMAYDAFSADPHVGYIEEPVGIEPAWRALTQHQSFSPKVWNDAYLAAFAQTIDYELVTFDKGFAQFKSLPCMILS